MGQHWCPLTIQCPGGSRCIRRRLTSTAKATQTGAVRRRVRMSRLARCCLPFLYGWSRLAWRSRPSRCSLGACGRGVVVPKAIAPSAAMTCGPRQIAVPSADRHTRRLWRRKSDRLRNYRGTDFQAVVRYAGHAGGFTGLPARRNLHVGGPYVRCRGNDHGEAGVCSAVH